MLKYVYFALYIISIISFGMAFSFTANNYGNELVRGLLLFAGVITFFFAYFTRRKYKNDNKK